VGRGAEQGFERGALDRGPDSFGNGDGAHLAAVGIFAHAGGGHATFGGEGAVFFPNPDEVADGFRPDFLDQEFDLKHLLEVERRVEVKGGVDARPGDPFVVWNPFGILPDGELKGAEEGVFRALRETEKVGEVNDAGHVRIRELNAVGVNKSVFGHGSAGGMKRLGDGFSAQHRGQGKS